MLKPNKRDLDWPIDGYLSNILSCPKTAWQYDLWWELDCAVIAVMWDEDSSFRNCVMGYATKKAPKVSQRGCVKEKKMISKGYKEPLQVLGLDQR